MNILGHAKIDFLKLFFQNGFGQLFYSDKYVKSIS